MASYSLGGRFLDVKGKGGENIFQRLLQTWVPGRVSIQKGTVISSKNPSINSFDCIIFNHMDSPVFKSFTDTVVLPIEGVLSAIEINTNAQTSCDKLIEDARRLKNLCELFDSALPAPLTVVEHRMQHERYLIGHQTPYKKVLSIIFAESIAASLDTAVKHLVTHNMLVGVDYSVDGIFVLDQGFALHTDPNSPSWITSRMAGSDFALLKTDPGHVLLKLQTIILHHIQTNPSFDLYLAEEGQIKEEFNRVNIISDKDYKQQVSKAIPIRA